MRQFVLVGHDVPTTPSFSLDDLAGGAGRLDSLCRSITAALLYSHGIRESVRVHLVAQNELTITVDGGSVRHLHPDERSTAALIRTALEARDDAIGAIPADPASGISVFRRGLAGTLDAVADAGPVIRLDETAPPITAGPVPTDPTFVLSDHQDFTAEERHLIDDVAERRVRLGPRPLHANQAITVAHQYLDTEGYTVL
jgi:tRNA (pseudouridine54-N1)-methyltransferase